MSESPEWYSIVREVSETWHGASEEAVAIIAAGLFPYRLTLDGKQAAKEKPALSSPRADALRAWRTAEAKRRRVPAYVVLHDKAIRAMCERMPRTEHELGLIPGIGANKVKRYGADLLRMLHDPTIADEQPVEPQPDAPETEEEQIARVRASQAIRQALTGKKLSRERLATTTGIGAAILNRALASLVERGKVIESSGRYSLPKVVKKDS